jgi:putative ABC transport system ATP-binding protein
LLNGNKTTISIAHRLSTIKRSDSIIVLSADGKVAEQGPYSVLSKNPDGEFTKLMEWQLNGGATSPLSSSPESDRSSDNDEDIAVGEEVTREVEYEFDEQETQTPAGEAVRSDLGLSEGERGRH